nr:MAG TPA: hypothetical protein [Caudoviricetes sp.]
MFEYDGTSHHPNACGPETPPSRTAKPRLPFQFIECLYAPIVTPPV